MKATELRIGNYYNFVGLTGTELQEVKANFFSSLDDYGMELNGYHQPTPLTEKWLADFGFEKVVHASWATGQKVEYDVWALGEFTYNDIQKAWWVNGKILTVQPKYVHQLQNLYFALTGEELTLTP